MKKIISLIFAFSFIITLCGCSENKTATKSGAKTESNAAVTENRLGLLEASPSSDCLFNYGLVAVKVGDKWGFINKNGEMVIEPQFEKSGKFYQGVYAANQEDGTYRFMNTKGEWLTEPQRGMAAYFTEGYCYVRSVEEGESQEKILKNMFIDSSGQVCLELPDNSSSWPVYGGLIMVRTQERGLAIYTAEGEKLFELEGVHTFAGDESTYQLFYDGLLCVEKDGKWGAVNKKGEWVIEPQFDRMEYFENGISRAKLGDYQGYVDTTGKWVIEPQYKPDYDNFSEGLVAAQTENWSGYIDAKGNRVITISGYEYVIGTEFKGGVAAVNTSDGSGIIDKNGNWVLSPTYRFISQFNCGVAAVEVNFKQHGYIDSSGKLITDAIYRSTQRFYDDGYGVAQKENGKWVIVDTQGKVIIDGEFDGIGNYYTSYNDDGSFSGTSSSGR